MLSSHTTKWDTRVPLFVLKLYNILSDSKYEALVAWELSGTRFIIKNPVEFATQVLPKYYETNKFASFSRQLNIYGFYRVSDRRRTKQSSELSAVIYSHQHFNQAHPELLHLIQRKSGPYSQPRLHLGIPKKHIKTRSTSLPSPTLSYTSASTSISTSTSTSTSTSLVHSQPTSPVDPEFVFSQRCQSCEALMQEIAILRKTIEQYMLILHEPLIPDISNQMKSRSFHPVSAPVSNPTSCIPSPLEDTFSTYHSLTTDYPNLGYLTYQ